MLCLCKKLSTYQYSAITEVEALILRRWYASAPTLFQANASTSDRARTKRKRIQSQLPSSRTLSTSLPGSLNSAQPQPSRLPPSAAQLVRSYSDNKALEAFDKEFEPTIQSALCLPAKLFLCIEQNDKQIKAQQLFRRTCCYAFAKLHVKFKSIDPVIEILKNALPHTEITRAKIQNILRVGTKWLEIIEQVLTITRFRSPQVTGVLCLFDPPSCWERAKVEDRASALTMLCEKPNVLQEIKQISPWVNNVLNRLQSEHSFVRDPHTLMLQFHSQNRLAEPSTDSRPISELQTASKASSLAAVADVLVEGSDYHSDDALLLLLLLSFYSTRANFSLDFLIQGVTPRKRWTSTGDTEESDASCVGLDTQLVGLLSDNIRLASALHELESSGIVSSSQLDSYLIHADVSSAVRSKLSPECLAFWKQQAVLVAYRSISWKYLETPIPAIHSFLPHLKHALYNFQDCLEELPAYTRFDLASTLVEASRFPNIGWKRFAIEQAEVITRGLESSYVRARITESKSLLARITGDAHQDVAELDDGEICHLRDRRILSAVGWIYIQQSLDCAQVEDMSDAMEALKKWRPSNDSSPMEQAVSFRIGMLFGRFLRYQGEFTESLAHLEKSREQMTKTESIYLEEDRRDLICELADAFIELDEPISAERHLRAEIERSNQSFACRSQTPLQICLAEALFAQRRLNEAEQLGLEIKSRPRLLRSEKLRTSIILAKTYHVTANHENALTQWSAALTEIGKFRFVNGRTTRIIILSVGDILRRLDNELWMASSKQADCLDRLAQPGGTQYWIAGMKHWLEFLQNAQVRSRM